MNNVCHSLHFQYCNRLLYIKWKINISGIHILLSLLWLWPTSAWGIVYPCGRTLVAAAFENGWRHRGHRVIFLVIFESLLLWRHHIKISIRILHGEAGYTPPPYTLWTDLQDIFFLNVGKWIWFRYQKCFVNIFNYFFFKKRKTIGGTPGDPPLGKL